MMITRRRQLPALFFCLLLCVFLRPAAHADDVFDALEAAIENQQPFFDMANKGDVTFTRDIEIPANTIVVAPGTRIIIPANTTLTNNGIMELGSLKLDGGTVEVRGGIFRVNEGFERTGGTVEVYDGFNLFPAADVWPDNKNAIISNAGAATNLLFKPANDAAFGSAVQTANALSDNFVADISINGPVTLTGQHVLTHKTMLRVSGPNDGSLTLAEGSLLQYKDCGGTLSLENGGEPDKGAAVTVNGNLFINALTVEPGCTFTTAGESIVETGMLTLGGTLVLNGKIFRDNYQFYPYDNGTKVLGTVQVTKGFNLFRAEGNDGILQYIDDNHPVLTYPNGVIETNLCFRPQNENEFTSAVNTANGLANNFVADINIGSDLLLTDEHILTHKTEIRINGNNFGVAENAVLKYDNCGGNMFLSNRANAVVNGELLCNGSVSLEANCSLTVNEGA